MAILKNISLCYKVVSFACVNNCVAFGSCDLCLATYLLSLLSALIFVKF